jgi:DNA-directed RNA polymerase sigma subunit (sigma70/sigma32)
MILQWDEEIMLKDQVDKFLGLIYKRYALALRLRFGIDGMGEHTFKEIGEVLGVCPQRAQQMICKGLAVIRRRKKYFAGFIN